jgi:hypothetical protein
MNIPWWMGLSLGETFKGGKDTRKLQWADLPWEHGVD